MDPVFAYILAVIFFGFWASSAWHKFTDLSKFMSTIRAYNIIPNFAVRPAAYILVSFEFTIAVLILLQSQYGVIAGLTLLMVYSFILSFNVLRGHGGYDCGCHWGVRLVGDEKPIEARLIARNFLILGFMGFLLWPLAPRTLTITDWGGMIFMSVFLLIAFVTAQILMNNRDKFKEAGYV